MHEGKPGMTFGEIAENYGLYRPEVPAEAVDWFGLSGDDLVVDLAAGTGALTAALVGRVGYVVAVEPDVRMREIFARHHPRVPAVAGTAENLPLPDESADAVLVAMAWHWVDPHRAIPEIARVLRAEGSFGVLWNHRDLSVPWVADLDQFTRKARASQNGEGVNSRPARRDVPDPPTGSEFNPLQELRLTWSMTVTAGTLIGHLGTDASAIALAPADRQIVDEQVARYLSDELGLVGEGTIDLPMACRCLRTTRRPKAAAG